MGIRPTESASRWPSRSTNWPRKKIVGCDSKQWTRKNDNSMASVGKSIVSTSSSGNSWKPTRRARPAEILPRQPGRHEGNSHDLRSWRRPPISSARKTLRHSDTRFSSRTYRFSPSPESVAAEPGIRQAFRPGTADGPAGQTQVNPQAQPQRQSANQGSREGRPQAQPQRQEVNQGNRQGASAGQSQGQGARRGQSQGALKRPVTRCTAESAQEVNRRKKTRTKVSRLKRSEMQIEAE